MQEQGEEEGEEEIEREVGYNLFQRYYKLSECSCYSLSCSAIFAAKLSDLSNETLLQSVAWIVIVCFQMCICNRNTGY